MSLRARIILGALVIIALVNVASVAYFVDRERRSAVARLHDTIEEDTRLLQVVTAGPLYDGNVAQLGTTLDSMFANPDMLEIELKETRGDIALARQRPAVAQRGERIERDVAVVRGRDQLGKIRVAYTTANIEQRLADSRNAVVLFSLLLMTGLALVIYLLVARLTRPIERLTRAARAIAEGDLERDIDVRGAQELKILGQSFVRMRDAVRQKMADLEETNLRLAAEVRERERAEEGMRIKDNAIATSVNAVAITDDEGRIYYVNDAFVRMWGYADEREIIGKTPADLTLDPSEARAVVGKMLEQGFFLGELTGKRKDGTALPAQISASVVKDPQGTVTHLMASFVDISERKALERERARLAAIVESSADAIISRSLDGAVLTWNKAAEEMFGYGASEGVGKNIDFIIPADLQEEAAQRRALLETGAGGSSYDTVRLAKGGRRVEVSATQSPIRDGSGELTGVSLTYRDISERKMAEKTLRESEARIAEAYEILNDTLENAPAAIALYDAEDKLVAWNSMYKDTFFAFNPSLVRRGTDFRTMLTEFQASGQVLTPKRDGDEWIEERIRQHRHPSSTGEIEVTGGRWFQVRETLSASGRVASVYTDITELKSREAALRRLTEELESKVEERTAELAAANKELEAFAYSVSHDLRAPLRGIDGFSQVLASQYAEKLDPEARRLLERIRAGAQRMGHLIEDMLQLSRVARKAVQGTEVDLTALAQAVVDELKPEAAQRAVQWSIEPGMTVHGDRGLLRIALVNLLGNALKYTRGASPARIEFGVSRRAVDIVEFCIRDNGVGFDMAYAERLFKPFQRLHGVHEFEGSGIGLATVHRVIAKHGGEIRGEGRPGAGATFHFTLPA